jgi:hypothetical protein
MTPAVARSTAVTGEQLAGLRWLDEAARLEGSHVVIVRECSSGLLDAFGPFVGPIEASMFAERYVREVTELVVGGIEVIVTSLESGA